MSYRTSDQLHDLEINAPTWATPSVIFLEDGKEVFSHQGYIDQKILFDAWKIQIRRHRSI